MSKAKVAILGSGSLIGKWQHEVVTENRAQGEKFWIKAIVPF